MGYMKYLKLMNRMNAVTQVPQPPVPQFEKYCKLFVTDEEYDIMTKAALEQGDYAALRSHLEALGAYADALKDDGAALYETLRSYID